MKTYLSICIAVALTLLACEGAEDISSAPLSDPNISRGANAAAPRGSRIRDEMQGDDGLVDTASDNGDRTTRRREEASVGKPEFQYSLTSGDLGAQTTIEYLNSTDRRIVVNAQTEILLTKRSSGAWLLQLVDCQTGTTFKTSLASHEPGTSIAPSIGAAPTRGPFRVGAICYPGPANSGAEPIAPQTEAHPRRQVANSQP